jgi:hypothetical protein
MFILPVVVVNPVLKGKFTYKRSFIQILARAVQLFAI